MTLKQKISKRKGEFPKPGVIGTEGDWLPVGTLEVTAGTLCAVDVMLFNEDDGVVAKVPAGTYAVEGKVMDFAGHPRVSRVRAFLRGTTPKLGKELGEATTDLAMLAICDIKDVSSRMTDEDNEVLADLLSEVDVDGGDVKTLKVNKKPVTFAVVESGLGDGGYPTYALLDGKRTVGLEVEFLPAGFSLDDDGD